jgi:hypothetical protein
MIVAEERRGAGDAGETQTVGSALAEILRDPVRNLLGAWNWKTAMISVLIRATLFFSTNLRAGRGSAVRASLVEAGFAIVAAGVLGSVTQRLRATRPVWLTALTVWLGIPLVLLTMQVAVHSLFGTPHMKTGLIVSFCMAAVGSGFNWYAQRKGILLAGAGQNSADDLRRMPGVIVEFVLAGPKAMLRR